MATHGKASILLPGMLHAIAGTSRVQVEAATLAGALEELYRQIPALRHHLCEDSGRFRMHVLCFHNGQNTREMRNLDVSLRDGDEIAFLQAISGGCFQSAEARTDRPARDETNGVVGLWSAPSSTA